MSGDGRYAAERYIADHVRRIEECYDIYSDDGWTFKADSSSPHISWLGETAVVRIKCAHGLPASLDDITPPPGGWNSSDLDTHLSGLIGTREAASEVECLRCAHRPCCDQAHL